MPPLRILHLINSLDQGGAERVLSRLVAETADEIGQQHEVITLLDAGHYATAIAEAGVDVTELLLNRNRVEPAPLATGIELVRHRRPDVLMCWLYQSCVLGSAAKLALPRTRLIWNLRGTATDPPMMSRTHRMSVRALAVASALPWAIAVNSRAGRSEHERLGFHPRRWAYVPNGFEPAEWTPAAGERSAVRQELGVTDQTVVFVMAARVDPQKDHGLLLEAFGLLAAERPDVHLVLLGRETDLLVPPPQIRGRVSLLGPRDDVRRWLAGCDVGVLSSAYGEGLPNAVAEKMLSGLPCVVTDSGDSGLLIGDTGRMVPTSDAAALAAGMRWLAEMRPPERQRLGARARARVTDRYSMDAMLSGFTRLWADL